MQIGWLLVRKHPEVKRQGAKINLRDLESDPVVMFQHRHYVPLMLISTFVLPTLLPNILWGESLSVAYFCAVARYLAVLHATWLVNSAAHMWGDRPYDAGIAPAQNAAVSVLAVGEGFHNYHHAFPGDYSASEWTWSLNLTTAFIDAMALAGLAYDRRTMSGENVRRRMERTGPGASEGNEVEKDY